MMVAQPLWSRAIMIVSMTSKHFMVCRGGDGHRSPQAWWLLRICKTPFTMPSGIGHYPGHQSLFQPVHRLIERARHKANVAAVAGHFQSNRLTELAGLR